MLEKERERERRIGQRKLDAGDVAKTVALNQIRVRRREEKQEEEEAAWR